MTASEDRTALAAALPDVAGLDVVDLGCGTGELTRVLLERGARSVLALDLDADRLDLARDATPAVAPERLRFEQADLEQATLPFEAYDLACCTVLDRLADPLRFGRMVRSGLRQRAPLVCVVEPSAVASLVGELGQAGLEPVVVAPGVVAATKPPRRAG